MQYNNQAYLSNECEGKDAEATEWGVKLVPAALRAKVQSVVDGRQTA